MAPSENSTKNTRWIQRKDQNRHFFHSWCKYMVVLQMTCTWSPAASTSSTGWSSTCPGTRRRRRSRWTSLVPAPLPGRGSLSGSCLRNQTNPNLERSWHSSNLWYFYWHVLIKLHSSWPVRPVFASPLCWLVHNVSCAFAYLYDWQGRASGDLVLTPLLLRHLHHYLPTTIFNYRFRARPYQCWRRFWIIFKSENVI